ncbi:MAG: hypothetical protein AB1489_13190 [Acidobacteriota bacterium]
MSQQRLIYAITSIISFLAVLFFTYVFYTRYYKWEFNENGRYYDPETEMVYTRGGIIWSLPMVVFLFSGILFLVLFLWQQKRNG